MIIHPSIITTNPPQALVEIEKTRVCDILTAHNLDCKMFVSNRVTTVGDLLALDEKRCASLVATSSLSHEQVVDHVAACLAARAKARKGERRFAKDQSDL
jgi:hypothetical protein